MPGDATPVDDRVDLGDGARLGWGSLSRPEDEGTVRDRCRLDCVLLGVGLRSRLLVQPVERLCGRIFVGSQGRGEAEACIRLVPESGLEPPTY